MKKARITAIRPADDRNQVLTVEGGSGAVRLQPCAECPWRLDAPVGAFPAEAYRHSASCSHDMAFNTFACHMSGAEKPACCAGFLAVQGINNLGVRLRGLRDGLDIRKVKKTTPLYPSYRAMAIANGVPENDPALVECRDPDDPDHWRSMQERRANTKP